MKKRIINLLSILLVSTLLVGCNKKQNTSSNDGSEPTSSETPITKEWDSGLKTLMLQYVEEVVPYAEGIKDNYEYEVYQGALYIDDDNTSTLTIANYYQALEQAGWTSTLNESGGHELIDDGEVYYEVFKENGLRTNIVQYYINPYYGNEICLFYNESVNSKTLDTDWSADDKEALNLALGFVPVFMAFGSDYEWQTDELYAMLSDSYYQDLATAYISILVSGGFTLITTGEYAGYYSLTTSENNVIYAYAYFEAHFGNYLIFGVAPDTNTSATWPTSLLSDITEGTGYVIPSFNASSYTYYVLGGAVHVSASITTDIEDDYCEDLQDAELYLDYYGYWAVGAYPWEETFYVSFTTEYDEDYEAVGFSIAAYKTLPTSEMSNDWPTSAVATYLGNEMPAVPGANKMSSKSYKISYQEATSTSSAYMQVYCLDNGTPGLDAMEDSYLETFISNEWYIDYSQYDTLGYVVEDPLGKVHISFYTYNGFFRAFISLGNGTVHEASLTLNRTTAYAKAGTSLQLVAYRSMISSAVTFESSNLSIATVDPSSGLVNIDANAQVGDQVTITATAGVKTATCVITIRTEVVDTINQSFFGLVDGKDTYAEHTATGTSGTEYKAQCASKFGVQIRSKNQNSGIVGANPTGSCVSISITFHNKTPNGKQVDIYASNTAFDIEDMYDGSVTKVGTITYDSNNPTSVYEFTADYGYIGLRSADGAIYMTTIAITW